MAKTELVLLAALVSPSLGTAATRAQERDQRSLSAAVQSFKELHSQMEATGGQDLNIDALARRAGTDLSTRLEQFERLDPAGQQKLRQDLRGFAVIACPVFELACTAAAKGTKAEAVCRSALDYCAIWIEPRDSGWSVQVDQDVLHGPSSDKDFTQGTEFSWSGRRTRSWFPRPAFRLIDAPASYALHRPLLRKPQAYEISSYQFGYSGFTPRKGTFAECQKPRWAGNPVNEAGEGCILSETEAIHDDRPYAGLLYVRVRRSSVGNRTAWTSDLTVGVLGTGIGKAVQQFIHRNISDDVDPGGWHHQISNGGELTGKYRLALRWVAGEGGRFKEWPSLFDVTLGAEGNAGYYLNASASGRLRVGLLSTTPLLLERHGSDPFVLIPGEGIVRRPRQSRTRYEAYAWVTGAVTRWRYNALLEGQFSDSDVTLAFGKGEAPMKPWVGDWQVGLTGRWGRYTLTWNWFTKHSALFGGVNSRPHSWGTLTLAIRPRL